MSKQVVTVTFDGSEKQYDYLMEENIALPLKVGTQMQIKNENGYNYRDSIVIVKSKQAFLGSNKNCREIVDYKIVDEDKWFSEKPLIFVTSEDSYNVVGNSKLVKKENMNMNKMLNFNFGPVNSDRFALSPYGIAVMNNSNGKYVSYNADNQEAVDVDILNFSAKNMLYYIPCALANITIGDVIMHNNVPMFVCAIHDNNSIEAVDIACSEVKNILPVKSPFGFNFITKVVSLIDFKNISASNEQPFGNMLPFLLMSQDSDDNAMSTLLLMNAFNDKSAGLDMSNPLMLMALSGNNSNMKDMLPLLLLGAQNKL